MDEYREGCLKLEKARHSRVYEAEKRLLYLEHSIMMAYTLEITNILDEHLIHRRSMTMKALSENSEKIRRIEELKYGIIKDDNLPANFNFNPSTTTTTTTAPKKNNNNNNNNNNNTSNNSNDDLTNNFKVGAVPNDEDIFSNINNKKHDMALRGRVGNEDRYRVDDDILYDNDKAKKTKKGDNRNQKVKVQLELDDSEVLADLEELRGEKRPRDSDNHNGINGSTHANNQSSNVPERKAKKRK